MESTISKAKPAYKSMDYYFLREEGIRHIQKLAGSVWTDYNSHDPGITLLEVLCYAITDLGYRSNLPVEDLLADSQAQEAGRNFYGITDILSCNPVTVTDLRKLIIDHEGIRNAWVEKNESAAVRGLYNIMLELEDVMLDLGNGDEQVNLNFNIIKSNVTAGTTSYDFEVAFPFWDELAGVEESQGISSITSEANTMLFIEIQDGGVAQENANDYYAEIELELEGPQPLTLPVWIKVISENFDPGDMALQDAIKADLVDGTLVNVYWEKIQAAIAKVNEVKNNLHNYRSLCEDFHIFRAFRVQEISIRADVDLAPNAQAEEVLGEIYYRIHAFLSPRPQFHTLEDLLDEDRPIERIFEGPLLQHGFLDTEELEAIRQQDTIYTSDLLQLMADIPDVIAVRDLRITNHYNNDVLEQDAINCLKLASPDLYKPLLSPDKSRMNCYKDGLSVTADADTALAYFEALKSKAKQEKKIAVYDLSAPRGEDRAVADYFSVQHHFPPAYGIGVEELPASVPDSRKAKAAQLRGYLIFFDQLLANYLSQLANIRSLFSMEASVDNTYFFQSLANSVPEAGNLLYGTYDANLPDMAEPGATEEPGVFHERRNRFLDHLMARFCESFSDYALFHYAVTENVVTASESLITAKINFLQDYPILSGNRAKAFNYLAERPDDMDPGIMVPDVWDTENVSGLKKRIARKLGLESYERNHLFNENPFSYYFSVQDNAGEWSFELNTANTAYSLRSSVINYTSQTAAEADALRTAVLATQKSQYRLTGTQAGGDLSFELLDNDGIVIAVPDDTTVFDTEDERAGYIQGIVSFLSIDLDSSFTSGGFHVLEHLLLRPRLVDDTAVLNIPSDEEGVFLADPYSFRISFILPVQHTKFGNSGFRQYAQKVIRSETPAHIVPHLHWLDIVQINAFENDYRNWLEGLPDARDILIDELNTIINSA